MKYLKNKIGFKKYRVGIFSFYHPGRGLTTLAKDMRELIGKRNVKIFAREDGNHKYDSKYVTRESEMPLSEWVKKNNIQKLFVLQFMDRENEFAVIKRTTECELIFIPMVEWIERNHIESFYYFDKILCPTNQTYEICEKLKSNNIIPKHTKIFKTYWIVDSKWSKYNSKNKEDNIKILFDVGQGGYLFRKNIEWALLAFLNAEKENKNLHLVFKTQKPINQYNPFIQELLNSIKNKTIIEKDLPEDEYIKMKSGCDIFLTTTGFSGLELGPQEALSMNMPIISIDIPPMNEIVKNDENGWLFYPEYKTPLPNTFVFGFHPNVKELNRLLTILEKSDVDTIKSKNMMRTKIKKMRKAFIDDVKKVLK